MKIRSSSRWALVGLACLVVLAISLSVGSQQRVQSTTQLTVRTPVVADPLAEWGTQYAEVMRLTADLAESGSPELAKQIEDDLQGLDKALREYVRAAERLRHKDRAVSATIDSLDNSVQKESQLIQTLSSLMKLEHDMKTAVIRKIS